MRKSSMIFMLVCAVLIMARGYAADPQPEQADTTALATFETIDRGGLSYYSPSSEQLTLEIYNKSDWENFWKQDVSSISPEPQLPDIDFNKYLILVVIDQVRNSGGYDLEIKNIRIDKAVEGRPFEIIIELSQPGSAAGTTGALTRPYHIVKIEK